MPCATKWLTDAIAVRASVSKGEGLSFAYRPNAQCSQASVERMRSDAEGGIATQKRGNTAVVSSYAATGSVAPGEIASRLRDAPALGRRTLIIIKTSESSQYNKSK
ncbi:MAG: hypothetical protein V7K92_07010 [Nostoc sp.]|uniref:hypothetical protein n=1 Tax=Nostoc sp. TaxID=1180 RepID=UPI002FF06525